MSDFHASMPVEIHQIDTYQAKHQQKVNGFVRFPNFQQITSIVLFLLSFSQGVYAMYQAPITLCYLVLMILINITQIYTIVFWILVTKENSVHKNNKQNVQSFEIQENMENIKVQNYCRLCKTLTLKHSFHCKICKKCVNNYDHHCRWVNNCISSANYQQFIGMIVSLVTQGCLKIVLNGKLLKIEMEIQTTDINAPIFSLGIIINSLISLPVFILLLFHIYLIFKRKSTRQFLNKKNIQKQRQQDQNQVHQQQQKTQENQVQKTTNQIIPKRREKIGRKLLRKITIKQINPKFN